MLGMTRAAVPIWVLGVEIPEHRSTTQVGGDTIGDVGANRLEQRMAQDGD